jgi:hypothetical protein
MADSWAEWGIAKPTIPHSLRRSTYASCATTASVGDFSLLAVLVYVAHEYPARVAGAGYKLALSCLPAARS